MYHSLQKYTALPPKTDVFATHEYTLANLDFAIAVEPENQALHDYQKKCLQLREDGEPTLPTTLKQELAINPFLRSCEASLKRNVSSHFSLPLTEPVDVFRHTRLWKDKF